MSSPHVNERHLSYTQNTYTSKSSHDKRNMSVSENILYMKICICKGHLTTFMPVSITGESMYTLKPSDN
jgi:hypothetical protein